MFFDFTAIKKSKESLEKRLFEIRNQVLELQKKIDASRYAPASREDVKNHIKAYVKDASDAYAQKLLDKTTRYAKGAVTANGHDLRAFVTFGGAMGPGGSLPNQDFQPTSQEIGQSLCALFGPAMLDSLCAAIDAAPWPAGALPLNDRERLSAELGAQISKLTAEEAQILQQAADAGLSID